MQPHHQVQTTIVFLSAVFPAFLFQLSTLPGEGGVCRQQAGGARRRAGGLHGHWGRHISATGRPHHLTGGGRHRHFPTAFSDRHTTPAGTESRRPRAKAYCRRRGGFLGVGRGRLAPRCSISGAAARSGGSTSRLPASDAFPGLHASADRQNHNNNKKTPPRPLCQLIGRVSLSPRKTN